MLSRLVSCARVVRPSSRSSFASGVRLFSSEENLEKTALFDKHVELGGKMVPFAGYALPVQYADGVISNHHHVRNSAGLFDVSHMGQLRIYGSQRKEFLEKVTVVDLESLPLNHASLSLITNEQGGIKDDTVVTMRDDHVAMVVNGACKHKDLEHFNKIIAENFSDVQIDYRSDRSLLALQGPKAASVLSRFLPSDVDMNSWAFMTDRDIDVAGIPCTVNRCGYTGEDGFEISVPFDRTVELFDALNGQEEVLPAGLGVRDSLRLEAGLCLYGNDLDETTSPIEGLLAWTISKRRRGDGGFIGSDIILNQLKNGVSRKRCGLLIKGAPARQGTPILDIDGNNVGIVTSGTFSPTLKKPLSMGYVSTPLNKSGTELKVELRGKLVDAVVTKMPFTPANYHKVQ